MILNEISKIDLQYVTYALYALIAILIILILKFLPGITNIKKMAEKAKNYLLDSFNITLERSCLKSNKDEEAFEEAMQTLKSFIGGRNFKYKLPLTILIGKQSSGKTSLIQSLETEKPFEDIIGETCTWSFFNQGIILDTSSEIFSSSSENTDLKWHNTLNLLNYYRPDSPIDSAVLTVSLKDILTSDENIYKAAEEYYIKIWQMQKNLSISFPIYIVFTNADCIPGFGNFCNSIPEKDKNEIFGWSNSSSNNTIFVDEMFDEIISRIHYISQKLTVGSVDYQNHSGLYVFPFQFMKIKRKIETFLNYIIKSNSYHDNLNIRGIYFTGSATSFSKAQSQINESLRESKFGKLKNVCMRHAVNKIFFSTNLFTNKIFQEKYLTNSIKKIAFSKKRKIMFIQASLIALSILSIFNFIHFIHNIKKIQVDFLANIDSANEILKKSKSLRSLTYAESEDENFSKQVDSLIVTMSKLNAKNLKFVSIPASWNSKLGKNLEKFLGQLFEKVLFDPLQSKFSYKLKSLSNGPLKKVNKSNPDYYDPTNSVDLIRLYSYVKEISEIENIYYRIERLPYLKNIDDLTYVMEKLFNIKLQKIFFDNKKVFIKAINHINIKIESVFKFENKINLIFNKLLERFLKNTFEYENVNPHLTKLENTLWSIEHNKNKFHNIHVLKEIVENFISHFNRQELKWILQDNINFGSKFTSMLFRLKNSSILGEKAHRKTTESLKDSSVKLKKILENHKVPVVGKIIQTKSGKVELSKEFEEFQGYLNILSAKQFMQKETQTLNTNIPAHKTLTWDSVIIRSTVDAISSFESFMSSGLLQKKPKLKPTLESMALEHLIKFIETELEDAKILTDTISSVPNQSEQIVKKNLESNTHSLIKILSTLKENDNNMYQILKTMLMDQCYKSLFRIDKMLENANLYIDFKNKKFFFMNKDKIISKLEREQAELIKICNFAKPVIEMIKKIHEIDYEPQIEIVEKWSKILLEVDKHKKGDDSVIKQIEEIIINGMNYFENPNCDSDATSKVNQSKIFELIGGKVFSNIKTQCKDKNKQNFELEYSKFKKYMEKEASTFPYINNKASAEKLHNKWNEFKNNTKYEQNAEKLNLSKNTLDFLENMERSIKFVAAYFDPKGKATNIKITMRSRNCESMIENISNSKFIFGTQEYSLQSDPFTIPLSSTTLKTLLSLSKENNLLFKNGNKHNKEILNGSIPLLKWINKYISQTKGNIKEIKYEALLKNGEKVSTWIKMEIDGYLKSWPNFKLKAPAVFFKRKTITPKSCKNTKSKPTKKSLAKK
ncbi:type VI secretion protein IcmF/TssM N-terminal domain-containing protein [Candidatus Nesciobacter abundans]|uniref:Type VI secretion system component TssM1 N-terminal domain-containing protein n=1 Tax=Candidatus Nesciobacter abundans TaxID=2601668 RepID=A0A5C0UGR6_9PROT|nr:type VI secretion system protein [Candidatus Nesciobacter abundans]QEK38861.1 hypothetical protein FZC36_00175 [Candidatus Nesciobacter abundans]